MVAAAVDAYRVVDGDRDDLAAARRFANRAAAVAGRGWEAFDEVLPLLAHEESTSRAAAAEILGYLGQADPSLARAACDSLIAVAAGEVDDGVVNACCLATHRAGLPVAVACNLLRLAPNQRRIGAYNLALTVTSAPEHEAVRRELRAATDDPDPEVRRWAEIGLETAEGP